MDAHVARSGTPWQCRSNTAAILARDDGSVFEDEATADVYERRPTKRALRMVDGLAWSVAARRMDIVLTTTHLDDLRRFPRLGFGTCGRPLCLRHRAVRLLAAEIPLASRPRSVAFADRVSGPRDRVTTPPMARTLPQRRYPRTPGEIIFMEFLEPLARTQQELADALHIDRSGLNHLIQGRRSVTVETALRLEKVLGPSADLWLDLQQRLDVWRALRNPSVREVLDALEPLTKGDRKRYALNPTNKFGYGKNPYHAPPD